MQSTPYATAVAELIQSGMDADTALHGLDRVLTQRGHQKLKGRILRDLKTLLDDGGVSKATLVLAREADQVAHKEAIAHAAAQLGVEGEPELVIDDTLVGGFTLSTRTHRRDQSYKRALIDLYQKITNTPSPN